MDIKLLVIDVDGTMTDAGIYYDEKGNELKKFSVKDAAGFFVAHKLGIKTMVLTGRECVATARRMQELRVDYLYQNVKDKRNFLEKFMEENQLKKHEVGYIGDDLNDFEAMKIVGYVGCPADSCTEILEYANYVSSKKGGEGAVRNIIEHMLKESGKWEDAVEKIYNVGI